MTRVFSPVWRHVISKVCVKHCVYKATDVCCKGAVVEDEETASCCWRYSTKVALKTTLKKFKFPLFIHNSIPVDETFIYNLNGM